MICCNINVLVSFVEQTLTKKDTCVVEGDYNTTKFVFTFKEDVSDQRIVFKMSNPKGELIMMEELSGNEIVLAGRNEAGEICSIFNMEGLHPFELVLYGENSKLTSATGWLPVNKRQAKAESGSGVEYYLPVFEELSAKVERLSNFDFQIEKADNATTLTVTNLEGETQSVTIYDREPGSAEVSADSIPYANENSPGITNVKEALDATAQGFLTMSGQFNDLNSQLEEVDNQVEELSKESHTHSNSSVLDEFSEDASGNPLYKGKPLSSSSSSASAIWTSKSYASDYSEAWVVTNNLSSSAIDFLIAEPVADAIPFGLSVEYDGKTYNEVSMIANQLLQGTECIKFYHEPWYDESWGLYVVAQIVTPNGQSDSPLYNSILLDDGMVTGFKIDYLKASFMPMGE